jgi:hypothetical protein
MGFDSKAFQGVAAASEAGFTFEPRVPGTGEGIGATITVCGPESAAARKLVREQLKRLQVLELAAKREGQPTDNLSLIMAQDMDEAARQKARTAAAYTLAWADITDNGSPLSCTPENALALYAEHSWLADQVIAKAQDLGNFVRASCKPSSSTPARNSAST